MKASMHWPRANRVGVHSTGASFHDLVRMSSGNIGLRSAMEGLQVKLAAAAVTLKAVREPGTSREI